MPGLEGGKGPPLRGAAFAGRWNGRPVSDLTAFVREHMPRTLPGALNDRSYLDVTAYVLARNGAPLDEPLAPDARWTIHIASP
jgi:hypothetical protein